jgi:hypothetical protein
MHVPAWTAVKYCKASRYITRVSARRLRARIAILGGCVFFGLVLSAVAGENSAVTRFQDDIQPILIDYCYRCHADGNKKGGVSFDDAAAASPSAA